ncbi:MAG: hypothetical protein ACKOX6_00735 [Bdellovibrio sp.]
MATTPQKPATTQPAFSEPKPASVGGNTQPVERVGTAASQPAAQAPAPQAPAPAAQDAIKVQVVPAVGNPVPPTQAAPDGTDPSKYPLDGTSREGLAGGVAGATSLGDPVQPAILDGNPPAYNAEDKHDIVEEPTAPARIVQHMKMADFSEGSTVYKLGVSHPPYLVETVGKGSVTLLAGTGGRVTVNNDQEASFFTNDQSRQYAVADGNPNANGDVKAP